QRVWVTFSGYEAGVKVFGTTDGGRTWNNLSGQLPNLPVSSAAAQKSPANAIYVGTDAGVFYRDDRIGQWGPFGDGMPTVSVTSLVIDEARSRIFAATYGRGVWLSDLPKPCYENCPQTPPRQAQASGGHTQRPSGSYVGPVDIFE